MGATTFERSTAFWVGRGVEDEPEPEDLEQGIPSRSALKVLGTRHRVKYRSNMITLTRQNHINFKSSIEKVPTNDKYGNLKYFTNLTRRADSEVNYLPTSRAKESSRVLLYDQLGGFVPNSESASATSGSVSASDGPPPLACKRAIQRVWPRVFSVDHTTSIQIRLPELTNVGTVVFRLFPLPQNGDLFKVPSLREWPFPLPP
ncbi:hypothetical protein BGY98DRAFT_1173616 [Russula aff. rugulosa BPL654]|nr:hypothetical protein BGY98DRAFT_1173616 [Russula aff. rugulosa BPL654]